MISSTLASTAGLLFDIAGAVMLYVYGTPIRQETSNGDLYVPVSFGSQEVKTARKEKYEKDQCRSRIAIWLLGIGFSLQLIGNML